MSSNKTLAQKTKDLDSLIIDFYNKYQAEFNLICEEKCIKLKKGERECFIEKLGEEMTKRGLGTLGIKNQTVAEIVILFNPKTLDASIAGPIFEIVWEGGSKLPLIRLRSKWTDSTTIKAECKKQKMPNLECTIEFDGDYNEPAVMDNILNQVKDIISSNYDFKKVVEIANSMVKS
ncbi:MAG: hypothetical protein RSB61_00745 [Clostridia bacterium]